MKIKNGILIRGTGFFNALQKLSRWSGTPSSSIMAQVKIARIMKEIAEESKLLNSVWQKKLDTYLEATPEGGKKVIDDKAEELEKVGNEFFEKEAELVQKPLTMKEIEGSGLSAEDLLALEPVLKDVL